MSSSDAVEPAAGKRLYGWLSPDEAKRLGAFLRSKTVTDCMQLILNGDVVDVWICPHHVRPPSPWTCSINEAAQPASARP
jgi:hypothetical protein